MNTDVDFQEMAFRLTVICEELRKDKCMRCAQRSYSDRPPGCLHSAITVFLIADQGHPFIEQDCSCGNDHADDIRQWRADRGAPKPKEESHEHRRSKPTPTNWTPRTPRRG